MEWKNVKSSECELTDSKVPSVPIITVNSDDFQEKDKAKRRM